MKQAAVRAEKLEKFLQWKLKHHKYSHDSCYFGMFRWFSFSVLFGKSIFKWNPQHFSYFCYVFLPCVGCIEFELAIEKNRENKAISQWLWKMNPFYSCIHIEHIEYIHYTLHNT